LKFIRIAAVRDRPADWVPTRGYQYGNIRLVKVISRNDIRKFARNEPRALEPLMRWATVVERANWQNPAELREQFGSADFVGDLTVFDIGGNKFRLIAFVHYRKHFVLIKRILTHGDYDKGAWRT
jgi:mRNA interferase HigB